MSEPLLRIVILVAVLATAAAVALAWPRLAGRQRRRRVRLDGLGSWPAVVVFTSDSCSTCTPALEVVRSVAGGWPVHRVDFGKHPEAFQDAGVTEVPLVVVVAADGTVVRSFAGVPDRRRLRRALNHKIVLRAQRA